MTIQIRGQEDPETINISKALRGYAEQHRRAEIELYRQNPVSIRVRVVDPDFKEMTRRERSRAVWEYLHKLPEDTQANISVVITITEEEKPGSLVNLEFDNPIPSRL